MNLEKLMSMIGGEGEQEESGSEHMEKMKKAYRLMKKATELIGECCEEGEYEDEDEESSGRVMPVATTFVIQKSKS